MKKLFTVFISLVVLSCFSNELEAQCEFHEGLTYDNALIYPLPFGVISEADGGLGINKNAVVGLPYNFNWTMIWPDSFPNPITGEIGYADTIQFFLDQTIWIFEGDTVSIPEGLSLTIDPESGISLPSDSNPVACIAINGTPSSNVTPGDYLMTFSVKTCLNIPGLFDGCQDALIPSITAGFPGEYRLTIQPEGTTAVKETLNSSVDLKVGPNPFSNETFISFNASGLSKDYLFEVFDVNGRKVQSHSMNLKSAEQKIVFSGEGLDPGLYIFQIAGAEGIITGKLMLQK